MVSKNKAIDIKNVSVFYNGKAALKDVTVSVPEGSICGLVGMNGAGKSTLFKAIMNAAPRRRGTVQLLGKPLKIAQASGTVAYVPQTELIDWDFPVSVRDVVMMGRYHMMGWRRKPSTADHEAVDTALARVHLTELADRQIGQLSGGQRKRAFVGRALAQGASILLLDEPFAGVDIKTEVSLIELLKELQTQGVTILIAAHDLGSIGSYCDHVILLKQTIIAAGPTKKVFTRANIAKTYDGLFGREGSLPWTT